MRKLIIIVVFIALGQCVYSQNSPSTGAEEVFSLRECMLYALENSYDAKIKQRENDSKAADYRSAYMEWLPSINGSISASSSFGRGIDPNTNVYNNITSFSNGYSIDASYTIFNGFSVINNFRIAKVSKATGLSEAQMVEDDICLNVTQAYFNVLYYKELVRISREQLEESKKNYQRTVLLEEVGLKGHTDVLDMDAKVASEQLSLTRKVNNYEQAVLTLKNLMCFPFDQDLSIAADIVLVECPDSDRVNIDSVFNSAKTFLPSVKIVEAEVLSAKYRWQTAKLRILPSLFVSGGFSTGYMSYLSGSSVNVKPFFNQLGDKMGEYVGVSMRIPIFNGLSGYANTRKYKNSFMIAKYNKDKKLQELSLEIHKAVQEMEGAAKEYAFAQKNEEAQSLAYRANSKKYDEGLISVLDLMISSNRWNVAQVEALNSALVYMLKKKVVDFYNGIGWVEGAQN